MERFTVEIITPERRAFSEEVEAVYVPTNDGRIGLLAKHMPLFSLLSEGEIKIENGTKEYFLAIGGGYAQVDDKGVSILVSRAMHADEINEAEINKAVAAAKEALKRKVKGDEYRQAQAILRRSSIELRVSRHRARGMRKPQTELPS